MSTQNLIISGKMSKKVFKDKALQDQMKVNIKHIFRKNVFLNKNHLVRKCFIFNYKSMICTLCSNTRPVFYERIFKYYVDICYSFYRINCQALPVEIKKKLWKQIVLIFWIFPLLMGNLQQVSVNLVRSLGQCYS